MNNQMQKLLNRKFKFTLSLLLLIQGITLIFVFYSYFFHNLAEFKGALLGLILGGLFFLIWYIIVKKKSLSNVFVLFLYTLGVFPIKLVFFTIFIFGGIFYFAMNYYFFSISFLFSIISSIIIEVSFVIAVNKLIKDSKKILNE